MAHATLSQDIRNCIQECVNCHGVCLETSVHCLSEGGIHAAADHVQTLLDCAEFCQTAANAMLRHSPLHGRSCELCAEACDRCADSCDRITGDAQMRACADACRRCASTCRSMTAIPLAA
jgi:hypothetical protein